MIQDFMLKRSKVSGIANYDTLAAALEIEQRSAKMRQAYKAESDPTHDEYKALLDNNHGDAETRRLEWLAKKVEIKARFGE